VLTQLIVDHFPLLTPAVARPVLSGRGLWARRKRPRFCTMCRCCRKAGSSWESGGEDEAKGLPAAFFWGIEGQVYTALRGGTGGSVGRVHAPHNPLFGLQGVQSVLPIRTLQPPGYPQLVSRPKEKPLEGTVPHGHSCPARSEAHTQMGVSFPPGPGCGACLPGCALGNLSSVSGLLEGIGQVG